MAEEGVGIPDFLEASFVGEDFGSAGDADLIVIEGEVAEFDAGVGRDFFCFVVAFEIRDIDDEAIGADRGDGTQAGLVTIRGGEKWKAVGGDDVAGELGEVERVGELA